ncbi:MAG: DegT/DnrJ/EryC1/StrS family aminotransferase [Thiogranum sp.]
MNQAQRNLSERPAVPLLDLKAQYVQLEDEISDALREVCASQYFILGPGVKKLEEAIAAYCQCDHGIGVSSGTDALLVALMALEIGLGDEVITTPYTFFATGGSIVRTGARPLFCDIDPLTYNLSPSSINELISEQCEMRGDQLFNRATGGKVRAILPVHLYGQMADMDPIMDTAHRYKLSVVEDAAQAIGSEYPGKRRAGSIGDIGCFSFFPSKNLGCFGDGGMCTSNDPKLAERIRILRVHGGKPKYHHAIIGGNFRLDALQAAVLSVKLKYLDGWTAKRQENARYYDEAFANAGLGEQVSTPRALEGYRHIYNQYVLRVQRRDELRAWLTENRIGSEIYYPIPLHMQKCFETLDYQPEDCPVSAQAAAETLAIPIYPELSREQQDSVVDTIADFYR